HCMLPLAAVREYQHDLSVSNIAADMAGNGPYRRIRCTPYQGCVKPPCGTSEELPGQPVVSVLVLGHNQQSRCVLVNAVHQPRTNLSRPEERQVPEVIHQGVHECARVVPIGRMNHHSCGLVNNYQVIIFINNRDGNILRYKFNLPGRIGKEDLDYIKWFDPVVWLDGGIVYQ